MIQQTSDLTMEVTIADRSAMETELEAAVSRARETAVKEQAGILVTRNGPTTFTVEVSGEVPYGLTEEQQAW